MDPVRVAQADEHPGLTDATYLARRAEIAAASSAAGAEPTPAITYTATEDEVWSTVSTALDQLHQDFAAAEYLRGAAALSLPRDRVPQLRWVSDRLQSLTGWRVRAVPGLVPTRTFYGALAERTFLSTQYVRHPSVPFYTPEPDIIHELIGHVNALASPRMARVYEAAGQASLRAADDVALERFSRVFWFTLEFGLIREHGSIRTYGAGLLSSFGEIQSFRSATIHPLDIEAMATFDYDINRFQDVLFCADSFDAAEDAMFGFFNATTTTGSPGR
ncbi:MAG TPA: phenylalanine 4-monooxygenase [Ilumatobacteraceae bacterium]